MQFDETETTLGSMQYVWQFLDQQACWCEL